MKTLIAVLFLLAGQVQANETADGIAAYKAGNYEKAFQLWELAIGLHGKQAECQIRQLANKTTAPGILVQAMSWAHGYCEFPVTLEIAAPGFRKAGEMFADQGNLQMANYCLSYLMDLPDDVIVRGHRKSLYNKINQAKVKGN